MELKNNEIDKRRNKIELMREDITRLASFPAQNPYPIVEITENGKLTYANRTALVEFPELLKGDKKYQHDEKHPLIKDIQKNIDLLKAEKSIIIETTYRDRVYEQHLWYSSEEQRIRSYIQDVTTRKTLEETLDWNLKIQNTLNSILKITLETLSTTEVLEKTLEIILDLSWLSFEKKGCIFILNKKANQLNMVVQKGLAREIKELCKTIPMGRCLCGKAVSTGQLQYTSHLDEHHEIRYPGITDHGHYAVPIKIKGKVTGVLNVYLKAGHKRTDKEEEFLKTIAGLVGLIIEHKNIEERVRENERFLKHAMKIAKMGMWEWNIKENKLFWSDETCKLFGITPGEFKGEYESFLSFIHPEDVEFVKMNVNNALRSRGLYDIEHRIIRKDGKVRTVNEKAEVFFDERGDAVRMIGTVHDITDEKEKEQMKDDLYNLREALINATLLISGNLEKEQIINNALSKIKELADAHYTAYFGIENRNAVEFFQNGELKKLEDSMVRRMVKNRLINHFIKNPEFIKLDDVSVHPLSTGFPEDHPEIGPIIIAPIKNDEKLTGIFLIGRQKESKPFSSIESDIVKSLVRHVAVAVQNALLYEEVKYLNKELEKRVEKATRELKKALKEAEYASKAKSRFLANMSHELRTPLNAIIGFAEILNEEYFGKLTGRQKEYITDILESAHHLLSIINGILDLSKIEAGKLELELEEINIADLLEQSIVMIREKSLKHGINLSIKISDELKNIRIFADRRNLKQVMFNLLSNASKFTPDGGNITVMGELKNDRIVVSVEDSGVGITPEEQERIFEEFQQITSRISGKPDGTGLGLSIVKKIIELHGGKVWVHSEGLNKGSKFSFSIPIRQRSK